MTDYVCNIFAVEVSEEEKRSSSYHPMKVLTVTNTTIRCLSPKMVLLGTENCICLEVWEEKILPIFTQIDSSCFLKCCRDFLTSLHIFISRDRQILEENVSCHVFFHRYYK